MEFLEVAAAATQTHSQHVWGWFGIQSHSHHRIVPKTYQKQRRLDQGLIQHVAASTCQAERDLWYEPVDSFRRPVEPPNAAAMLIHVAWRWQVERKQP